jgi:hypothetical protein
MISHSGRKRVAASVATARILKPKLTCQPHECEYDDLLLSVKKTFAAVSGGGNLFATDADGLWSLYLKNIPVKQRQFHNCHCCRRFIETFGRLVAIDERGRATPAMWGADVGGFYGPSFSAMHARVKTARVTSVFFSKESVWGMPATPGWTHLSVAPPARLVYADWLLTPGQKMAETKENYRNVAAALGEFKPAVLDEALRVLRAEILSSSDKFIGPVQWLRDLHDRPKGRAGENVIWRAVADAPAGFCHPRASMAGTLLEDVAAGLSFAEVKRRFDAKVSPLRYQRPQAAPAAGNIQAAERIVEKLSIERSLERRFARLGDVETIWAPRESTPQGGGVFGHLRAKQSVAPALSLPRQTMTWVKFSQTVLYAAEKIELLVPSHGKFIALTAATHADAPPILKWDRQERRNTVAWYVYASGSAASQWGLRGGSWAKVNAAALLPTMWGGRPMPHLSEGVVLIVDGAVDSRNDSAALFPECLRDELHAIRSTIEAHSRSSRLTGVEQASACGYDLRKPDAACVLRVLSAGAWREYAIDRWD